MTKDAAISHYAEVGAETGITDVSPHGLILMLLEGAIISAGIAKMHIQNNNIPEKCAAISKALAIVDDGLRASLDKKAGGEIAENLDALYEYLGNQLIAANIHNQTEPLDEVVRLLTEIKSAWAEIDSSKKKTDVSPKAAEDEPQPPRTPQSYGKA